MILNYFHKPFNNLYNIQNIRQDVPVRVLLYGVKRSGNIMQVSQLFYRNIPYQLVNVLSQAYFNNKGDLFARSKMGCLFDLVNHTVPGQASRSQFTSIKRQFSPVNDNLLVLKH